MIKSNRIIVNNRKYSYSYGILLFCNTTKRFICIRKKITYGFLRILYANYLSYELDNLINDLKYDEANELLKSEDDYEYFKLIIDKNNVKINLETMKVSYDKFKLYDGFIKLKEKTDYKLKDEYGLPKGIRDGTEDKLKCAIREFEEETTLNLDNCTLNEDVKLIVEFSSEDNKINISTFYTYITNEEKQLNDMTLNNEVEEVYWISLDDFKKDCKKSFLNCIDDIKLLY